MKRRVGIGTTNYKIIYTCRRSQRIDNNCVSTRNTIIINIYLTTNLRLGLFTNSKKLIVIYTRSHSITIIMHVDEPLLEAFVVCVLRLEL